MSREVPDWFRKSLQRIDAAKDRTGVVLVANVKDRTTPLDDYDGDSITTEFLSSRELDEFIEGFAKADIYCETLLDEAGFIEWLNAGKVRFGRAMPLIYNLAQNGTGPARLTLVPGLCRLHRLSLVDSDGYGVALDQHKFHVISLLRSFGLPVADVWWHSKSGWFPTTPPNGLKVIAKPTYESASIGIHKENVGVIGEGIEKRLAELERQYRQPITVQEFISGFEIEVPVFDDGTPRAIAAVGIEVDRRKKLGDSILTYDEVYADRYRFYDFAEQDARAARELMEIAVTAHRGLSLAGPARVDFRLGSDGRPRVMEVNCKPHLTRHSSYAHVSCEMGLDHSDLLKFLVGSACVRLGLT